MVVVAKGYAAYHLQLLEKEKKFYLCLKDIKLWHDPASNDTF